MSDGSVDVDRLKMEVESLRSEGLRQADGWMSEKQESKRLRAIVTKLENRIENLEEDLSKLTTAHEELETEHGTVVRDREGLKKRVHDLEAELEELRPSDGK